MAAMPITRDGHERLTEQLERLKTTERRTLAEQIQHALATHGNAAETFEYQQAREEQELLERRIAVLERALLGTEVVEPDASNGLVDVGERVRVRELETGKRVELMLVGPLEADPLDGKVSTVSPVGRALLGRRRGEVAAVDAPAGRMHYKILAVDVAAA